MERGSEPSNGACSPEAAIAEFSASVAMKGQNWLRREIPKRIMKNSQGLISTCLYRILNKKTKAATNKNETGDGGGIERG